MSAALVEARERAEAELLKFADIAEERQLTDDEKTKVAEIKAEIEDLRSREALQAETAELRNRQSDVAQVAKPAASAPSVREVSPYGEDSSESWFADFRTARDRYASDREVNEARGRMEKHYAAMNDEGGARQARALSTTDAEGGYLVAPAHLQNQFARILVNGATVTQLVGKMPLPPKTDQINLPKQDGAVAIAQHTQNAALTETSATFTTVQASVVRYGGAQTIPNFLLDRSLPGIDGIVLGDLGRQLAAKVDTDLIGGTTPEGILNADGIGTATATGGTATMSELWPALVNAIADVQSAHYASPDAIVMHPRRWAWMVAQLDGDKRPLLGAVSAFNAVASHVGQHGAVEADAVAMPVGQVLGIPVYLDSNIPTNLGAGTDEDRIIVGVFKEAMLFQSAPMFGISTEAEFLKDQTLVRVTQDVAFTAERYPGAFSVISGTALNDVA